MTVSDKLNTSNNLAEPQRNLEKTIVAVETLKLKRMWRLLPAYGPMETNVAGPIFSSIGTMRLRDALQNS
jgi:hypothetical protein